jgi:hypothetical protein
VTGGKSDRIKKQPNASDRQHSTDEKFYFAARAASGIEFHNEE